MGQEHFEGAPVNLALGLRYGRNYGVQNVLFRCEIAILPFFDPLLDPFGRGWSGRAGLHLGQKDGELCGSTLSLGMGVRGLVVPVKRAAETQVKQPPNATVRPLEMQKI